MKKLTQREKLLIYILGCFLIGFFSLYFVMLPSYSSYQVVRDQAAEARFTQESMVMAIDSIPSTMQARDDANSELAILKAPFPQALTNEGLDMLLTQLCLDYSLSPKVLAIESNGMAGAETFVPYTSDQQASAEMGSGETTTTEATTTNEEAVTDITSTETSNSLDTATATESTTNDEGIQTLIGVVNMELTGTQTNFYRLLDAVAARPDMVITAFAIAPEATTTATTVPQLNGGNISINVTFTVYMMEK